MTEEEPLKAYFEWRRIASQNLHPSTPMKNATPKPLLEARLDWLEADASAQRTDIIKLARATRLICKFLWLLLVISMILALKVLT